MPRLVSALLCFLATACAFAPPMGAAVTRSAVRPAAASVVMGGAATKATRVNMRNRAYNKKYKSEMRTMIKKVGSALLSLWLDRVARTAHSRGRRTHATRCCRDALPPCGWLQATCAAAATVAAASCCSQRQRAQAHDLLAAAPRRRASCPGRVQERPVIATHPDGALPPRAAGLRGRR